MFSRRQGKPDEGLSFCFFVTGEEACFDKFLDSQGCSHGLPWEFVFCDFHGDIIFLSDESEGIWYSVRAYFLGVEDGEGMFMPPVEGYGEVEILDETVFFCGEGLDECHDGKGFREVWARESRARSTRT